MRPWHSNVGSLPHRYTLCCTLFAPIGALYVTSSPPTLWFFTGPNAAPWQPSHWITSIKAMQLEAAHTTHATHGTPQNLNNPMPLQQHIGTQPRCRTSLLCVGRPDLPIVLCLGQPSSINPIQPPNGPSSLPFYLIPSSVSWFWSQLHFQCNFQAAKHKIDWRSWKKQMVINWYSFAATGIC